ncbi:MAG: hypothetical protein AAGF90_24495 [Pseudomonadota bacterium]
MAKSSKSRSHRASGTERETLLDRTTRLAREILDDETERRKQKTERLREARLESEAARRDAAAKAEPKPAPRKAKPKAAKPA